MIVRRVVPEDSAVLTQIALAAKRHWGYPERWIEIWTPQLTFSPDYFQSNEGWLAEIDGRPVAFYTLLEANETASIENLWVLPDFIGQGVGRTLFHHALDLLRQRGYTTVRLEADPNAMGFYEKMGMRQVGEHLSTVEGQPRILPIMEIDL